MHESIAFLWDMDGTLVDTAELHYQAWLQTCQKLGSTFTRDHFAATFGKRNPEIIQYLFDSRFTVQESNRIGDEKELTYRLAAQQQGVGLLPGVEKLLDQASKQGVRQAVASSAPRANVELILRLTQTSRYFHTQVAMEDTQRGKPDPEVFMKAADRLHVPYHRCIVFEDAIAGIQAAKTAGMWCVGVHFVGHHPPERMRLAGADWVVPSLCEVLFDELLRRVYFPVFPV